MTGLRAALTALAVHLPESVRTTDETEARLSLNNPGLTLPTGLIRRVTGVEQVRVKGADQQASDLAVLAAREVLERQPGDIDQLLFASASQDMIEPATAHIVAAKLGLNGTPVMDVKNACNSVVNAIQVAYGLIATGQARRVLIASGETPSTAVRWSVRDKAQFFRSFPGYTMSDGGAALIVEASEGPAGIDGMKFEAASDHWEVGRLPTGGSFEPRVMENTYFDMDGAALAEAFFSLGPGPIDRLLARLGRSLADFDLVAMHQVAAPHIPLIAEKLGLPRASLIETIGQYGNLASVTLPLQLRLAWDAGRIGVGSRVLLVGLAGGISMGALAVTL